jgi:Flp pilus assembly protein TadG
VPPVSHISGADLELTHCPAGSERCEAVTAAPQRRRHPSSGGGLRARARESRGQSTVELALVLPVLALVLFACLKVGLAFFSYEQVASAANAGARAAAVNHAGDPTDAARTAARSISPTLGLTNSQITVSYVSTASPPGASWSYPGTVTVTVDYPLTFSLLGQLPQTFDLKASATKRLER